MLCGKNVRNGVCVLLVVVGLAWSPQTVVTSARGDTVTLVSTGAAPNTPANTIATTDFTDWALGNGNSMAGGSQISVLSTVQFSDASYPTFTYLNGTSPVSATGQIGTFCWDGGDGDSNANSRIAIHVAAGSTGTVTLWGGGGTWASLETSFSPTGVYNTGTWNYLTMIGGMLDGHEGGANRKVVFTYASDSAQDLDILLNHGEPGSHNAGFFAVGVNAVPEPGTLVLVITGLIGLLAYAWRNRR